MASIFENISKEAFVEGITPQTQASMQWFGTKLQTMAGINTNDLFRDEKLKQRSTLLVNKSLIGTMHMFQYDPETKSELPYYDRYPLVIIVGKAKGGFRAINLHYLPVQLRIRFLDNLYKISTLENNFNSEWDDLNRGRIKKFIKPIIKTYLTPNIKGRIAQVHKNEWDIAAFLPFHKFMKRNEQVVWRDSFKQVYKR